LNQLESEQLGGSSESFGNVRPEAGWISEILKLSRGTAKNLELTMQRTLFHTASAFIALMLFNATTTARAFEISNPVVHDNLAVYFVHDPGRATPVPLTLDQAMSKGAVRISGDGPFTIENVSGQPVLVQLGDLLRGGLQDQVVGTSFLLPPRSDPVSLDTFCVDPFRAAPRDGENPHRFTAAGQFPWRMARLSMLTASPESKPVRELRQSGIWWSIDTLRSRLSERLGVEIEPPRAAHWAASDAQLRANSVLAARRSPWTSSLPLAMQNRSLAQAQQRYLAAFNGKDVPSSNVIGAVFAVNGQAIAAEIYSSAALFRQAWPKLLRAYVTEAIASTGSASAALPSPQAINVFLNSAQEGRTREIASATTLMTRDSDTILTEVTGRDGHWVYRSYVPKLGLASAPLNPEALIVHVLETGRVGGRPLSRLADTEHVILQGHFSGNAWTATVPGQNPVVGLWWRGTELIADSEPRRLLAAGLIATALLVLALYFIWPALTRRKLRLAEVPCAAGT
jgi:hypothetical protein